MVIFIEKGDIFKIEGVSSYAHGCNCVGAMGKGIAVQFKERFPLMYERYKELCKNGSFRPKDVFAYNYGNGYIYNLGTQESWRTRAKIEYIKGALENMIAAAREQNVDKIAIPAIGAGLGALDWDDVRRTILETCGNEKDITVYVVEKYG